MSSKRDEHADAHHHERQDRRICGAASLTARLRSGGYRRWRWWRAPAAACPAPESPASSTTRTGTRCTILVKLPVAFSAGMTLNTAPVPGARLATCPWNTWPGSTSATTVDGLPRSHAGELVFLEIRIDPEPVGGHDRDQIAPGGHVGADLAGAIADIAVDRRSDLGVAEIEFGRVHIGLCLRHRRIGLRDLRVEHLELLVGGLQRRRATRHGGLRFLLARRCVPRFWREPALVLRQRWAARRLLGGERRLRLFGGDVGFLLADRGLLQRVLRAQALGAAGAPSTTACGVVERGLVVARIEPISTWPA